jgi:hypothetical protein
MAPSSTFHFNSVVISLCDAVRYDEADGYLFEYSPQIPGLLEWDGKSSPKMMIKDYDDCVPEGSSVVFGELNLVSNNTYEAYSDVSGWKVVFYYVSGKLQLRSITYFTPVTRFSSTS